MKIKKSGQNLILCASLLSTLLLGACAQTELLEESISPVEKGEEIVLQLSAPESLTTRASSDHKLRFTAKLYQDRYDNSNGLGTVWLETKQGEASLNGMTTITFSVKPGIYSVLLFADYIPANSTPNADGIYPDVYYDTSSHLEDIRMIAFTENTSPYNLISQNCINNDNYDCFYGYTDVINKTEEKYEREITLKRAASKVRFESITEAPAEVTGIEFNNFYCFDVFNTFSETVTKIKGDESMRLSNHKLSGMSNPLNNELFYFYTLGGKDSGDLGVFDFDIKFSDGSSRNVRIESGIVKVVKNHVTTVRGALLSEDTSGIGDIILHLDTEPGWATPDVDIEYQEPSF